MGEMDINSATESGSTTAIGDLTINSETLDSPSKENGSSYVNTNWTKQYGYYKNTTDIREVIDARARWIVGKGYEADETTTMLFDTFRGNGSDTFNTILNNMIRVSEIGEDAYSEIIRDDNLELMNLKPLNTGNIKVLYNKKGIIIGYEQIGTKTKWETTDIFHLSRNRVGDEMHGQSMIDVLVDLITAKKEAIQDYRKVMHRFVTPMWKFKLDSDDPATIAAYKAKQDSATEKGENIYEPMGASESELVAVSPNATLNPLAWIQYLDAAFYKAAGVPQFIVGGGTGFTEASEKIAYLAWQQTIEERQLYIEEQVLAQLNKEINLIFPASLEQELISDNSKDGAQNIDQSELNPQSENV